jgi:hypothetical protein
MARASGLGAAAGIAAVAAIAVAVALWALKVGEEELGDLDAIAADPGAQGGSSAAAVGVRRRAAEPGSDGGEIGPEYQAAVRAYETSRAGADREDRIHDRRMAIGELGAMLDGIAGDSRAARLNREIIAANLERFFQSEREASVREEIVEAIGRGDSEAVARVLWAALADPAEPVRLGAEEQIDMILSFEESRSSRAAARLVERLRAQPDEVRAAAVARLRELLEEERA